MGNSILERFQEEFLFTLNLTGLQDVLRPVKDEEFLPALPHTWKNMWYEQCA
jgi:hypothetical protein